MNSVIYLLQVTACTAVFYLFYYFFLNRLTFFVTNRWYLLVTVVLSFMIPLLKITVSQPHVYTGVVEHVVYTYSPKIVENQPVIIQPVQVKAPPIHWGSILRYVYFAAVLALTVHLIVTLIAFFKRLKGKRITKIGNVNILSGNKKINNGSFLNYIFLNEDELSPNEIQQIIAHEMLHVRLYHSVDRIIVKLAQIILWFNPFIYLYARSVEENHEFEVDRAIARDSDKHNYANLLVHLSVAGNGMLYHNFSKVPLKKRITMLFNQPSANMKKIVYLLVVPVVLISCLAFARLKNKNAEKKYSVIERVEYLGKNPLILINGKKYDKGILYKISATCISSTGVFDPNPAIIKHGVAITDGYVEIRTNDGEISYMTANEKVNLIKERSIPTTQLYARITLIDDRGKPYQKVIVHSGGNVFRSTISKYGKAGFIISGKLYNETEIQQLSPEIKNNLSGGGGVAPATSQNFPGVDVAGYETIFRLQTKKNQKIIDSIIAVRMAYQKTDDYKHKVKLQEELYGKTINVAIKSLIKNKYATGKTDYIAFNYNGNKLFMTFSYGQPIVSKSALKVGDLLQIKVQSVLFGMDKSDSVEIAPAYILKGDEKIFELKGITTDSKAPEKNDPKGAVAPKGNIKDLFTRIAIKKNGKTYDKVKVQNNAGSWAETEIGPNGKVGFFIDYDFYSEDAFNKLPDATKMMIFNGDNVGATESKSFSALRKLGYKNDLKGYDAVFTFVVKSAELRRAIKGAFDKGKQTQQDNKSVVNNIATDDDYPLFFRDIVKKADGSIHDEVYTYSHDGSYCMTDIFHNGRVGFFVDHDFYNEEEFNKLSDKIKDRLLKSPTRRFTMLLHLINC